MLRNSIFHKFIKINSNLIIYIRKLIIYFYIDDSKDCANILHDLEKGNIIFAPNLENCLPNDQRIFLPEPLFG